MNILNVNETIKNLEGNLSDIRLKGFNLEVKIQESKEALEYMETEARKQAVFDSSLKNAEQRDMKAQEILGQTSTYPEIKSEIKHLHRDIFDNSEKERQVKSEIDFNKRLFQILLNQQSSLV